MTKESRVILNALRNARDTVDIFADDEFGRREDGYLRKLYIELNEICVRFREEYEDEADD